MANLERRTLNSMKLITQHHVGAFDGAKEAWDKLNNFVAVRKVASLEGMAIGICYDNPEVTANVRYDAAVNVDDTTAKRAALEKLDAKKHPGFRMGDLQGGSFIRTLHKGPYANIPATYKHLVNEARKEGVEIEPLPFIQIYHNSPLFTDEQELETEILVRVKGKT